MCSAVPYNMCMHVYLCFYANVCELIMCVCMDGWMNGWIDGWTYACTHGCMHACHVNPILPAKSG